MKFKTILLLSILSLAVVHIAIHEEHKLCTEEVYYGSTYEQEAKDLQIPDVVVSHTSDYHQSIANTGLSLVIPNGYRQTLIPYGIAKDRDTTIEVIEDRGNSIGAERAEIASNLKALQKYHPKEFQLSYKKDFRFNGYDATMMCMKNMVSDTTSVYMTFGDRQFHVSMIGTFKNDNPTAMQELVETFMTSVYKERTA